MEELKKQIVEKPKPRVRRMVVKRKVSPEPLPKKKVVDPKEPLKTELPEPIDPFPADRLVRDLNAAH